MAQRRRAFASAYIGRLFPGKSIQMSDPQAARMPKGIPFIVVNEFAERFCYYGINAILALYLVQYLHFGEAQATTWG